MQATEAIEMLLHFARAKGLLAQADVYFARNVLLGAMKMEAPVPSDEWLRDDFSLPDTATPMLKALADAAVARGIIEDMTFDRDQFCCHLMNLLTPLPSQIQAAFSQLRETRGIDVATSWLYQLCRSNDYIRVDEIARNIEFDAASPYGELKITINLSKPEKDPREIARAKDIPAVGYPRCMLCIENEGYVGHPGYPSHETLRTIPVTLRDEAWRFQYSPYSYYPEHCIVFNEVHQPMSISRRSFDLLTAFVDQFPHYFIGSNADLPIVGGSILSHDHFQGGRYVFPMDLAPAYAAYAHRDYPTVAIEAVRWPMTCLRLSGYDPQAITALSERLLAAWRNYDDPARDILHETGGTPHNTITPIARKTEDGGYVMQLVLRNNRTTAEHPLGIFHPHADLHHIKRENIGLIEVMGLFVLPGRLRDELLALSCYLTGEAPLVPPSDDDPLAPHFLWIESIVAKAGTCNAPREAGAILRKALTEKCVRVLEDAGVFKPTPDGDSGLLQFLASVGIAPMMPISLNA